MTQDLSKPQLNDPTTGKYVPQNPSTEPGVAVALPDDDSWQPNVAYESPARLPNQAQIIKDTPEVNESDLTDVAKRLLEWNEESELPEASTQTVEPEVVSEELKYTPEEVDWSYLKLGEDFGVPDLDTSIEASPDFQQWKQGFEQYLGHTWEEYKQARQEMKQARQLRKELEFQKHQRNLQQQAEFIRKSWGVDETEYHKRMQKVVEVFSKLDKTTQMLLDRDPAGALKLWKDIQMSESTQKPDVPKYEKSNPTQVSGVNNKPVFTGSQINSMPEAQRAALWDKIINASRQGLVDWSR